MSKSYTIEFNGTGEVLEGFFTNDTDAIKWVESVIDDREYDTAEIVSGDWGSDGQNDDGEACERMLFWADEASSVNDPGANAVCQLCVVR